MTQPTAADIVTAIYKAGSSEGAKKGWDRRREGGHNILHADKKNAEAVVQHLRNHGYRAMVDSSGENMHGYRNVVVHPQHLDKLLHDKAALAGIHRHLGHGKFTAAEMAKHIRENLKDGAEQKDMDRSFATEPKRRKATSPSNVSSDVKNEVSEWIDSNADSHRDARSLAQAARQEYSEHDLSNEGWVDDWAKEVLSHRVKKSGTTDGAKEGWEHRKIGIGATPPGTGPLGRRLVQSHINSAMQFVVNHPDAHIRNRLEDANAALGDGRDEEADQHLGRALDTLKSTPDHPAANLIRQARERLGVSKSEVADDTPADFDAPLSFNAVADGFAMQMKSFGVGSTDARLALAAELCGIVGEGEWPIQSGERGEILLDKSANWEDAIRVATSEAMAFLLEPIEKAGNAEGAKKGWQTRRYGGQQSAINVKNHVKELPKNRTQIAMKKVMVRTELNRLMRDPHLSSKFKGRLKEAMGQLNQMTALGDAPIRGKEKVGIGQTFQQISALMDEAQNRMPLNAPKPQPKTAPAAGKGQPPAKKVQAKKPFKKVDQIQPDEPTAHQKPAAPQAPAAKPAAAKPAVAAKPAQPAAPAAKAPPDQATEHEAELKQDDEQKLEQMKQQGQGGGTPLADAMQTKKGPTPEAMAAAKQKLQNIAASAKPTSKPASTTPITDATKAKKGPTPEATAAAKQKLQNLAAAKTAPAEPNPTGRAMTNAKPTPEAVAAWASKKGNFPPKGTPPNPPGTGKGTFPTAAAAVAPKAKAPPAAAPSVEATQPMKPQPKPAASPKQQGILQRAAAWLSQSDGKVNSAAEMVSSAAKRFANHIAGNIQTRMAYNQWSTSQGRATALHDVVTQESKTQTPAGIPPRSFFDHAAAFKKQQDDADAKRAAFFQRMGLSEEKQNQLSGKSLAAEPILETLESPYGGDEA